MKIRSHYWVNKPERARVNLARDSHIRKPKYSIYYDFYLLILFVCESKDDFLGWVLSFFPRVLSIKLWSLFGWNNRCYTGPSCQPLPRYNSNHAIPQKPASLYCFLLRPFLCSLVGNFFMGCHYCHKQLQALEVVSRFSCIPAGLELIEKLSEWPWTF